MQGLSRERVALSQHPRTRTHEALPRVAESLRPHLPRAHMGVVKVRQKKKKKKTNKKNQTKNHHTTNHALHTNLKICPSVVTHHWNTSCANIEVEWLKKLASYVEYIRGFFNLAFAACPFGVLSMATGTGWLLLQLSQAQGFALPCLDREGHWPPQGTLATDSSKAKTSHRRNPWTK